SQRRVKHFLVTAEIGQVQGKSLDTASAAHFQIVTDSRESIGGARDEEKIGPVAGEAFSRFLRDSRSRPGDQQLHALTFAETRRQKLDENFGSICRANSCQFG